MFHTKALSMILNYDCETFIVQETGLNTYLSNILIMKLGFSQVRKLEWISCHIVPLGVNFTNIWWTAFAPKSICQKITKPNCKHIKAAQKLSCEKAAHKILVKLTPGGRLCLIYFNNFNNYKTANNLLSTEARYKICAYFNS